MNKLEHKRITKPYIHEAIAFEYLTEADRAVGMDEVYGQTLADTDVGKFALTQDNGAVHRLAQVTPCVRWEWVGGYYGTARDNVYYINTDTGDDTTGNGTPTYPLKSLTGFYAWHPHAISHSTTVNISGAAACDRPSSMRFHGVDVNGQLLFQSTEAGTVVAGPFTVDTVTLEEPGDFFQQVEVLGGSFTPDEYQCEHIEVLTGSSAGRIYAIRSNTATGIGTGYNAVPMSPGDTFQVVRPATVVSAASDTSFTFQAESRAFTQSNPYGHNHHGFVGFVGLRFVSAYQMHFIGDDNRMLWQFCSLDIDSLIVDARRVSTSRELLDMSVISDAALRDTDFAGLAVKVAANRGIFIESSERSNITRLVCNGNIWTLAFASTLVQQCAFKDAYADLRSDLSVYRSSFLPSDYAPIYANNSFVVLLEVHFEGAGVVAPYGIAALDGAKMDVTGEVTAVNINGHGMHMSAGSTVTLSNDFPTGSAGDIYFAQTSATATYPTAGNAQTDSQGSRVIRRP